MPKKSALGSMVQQSVLPQIQQMQQQSTQAIMQAIQSIQIPEGIDPRMLQQIEMAIQSIQQIDIMPIVQTLQNMSDQIESLSMAENRPTSWTMTVERDPETYFIKAAHIEPLFELPNMETSDVEIEVIN